jgi:hypothetical protein
MSSALLRSGSLKDFHALGAVGNPVYRAASQLRAAMRRQKELGPDVADLFAIPKQNETGDSIDWYAPVAGDIVPWSAATSEEQSEAKTALLEARRRLAEKSQEFQSEDNGERQVFGKLLAQATRIPSDDHVYLVNGKPVLTFWGFAEHNAPSGQDVLGGLNVAPVVPVAAAAVPKTEQPAMPPPIVVEQERRRGRPWWWWLLLIPLLLLLLALLLFGLRSCGFDVPFASWVGFPAIETPAVVVDEREPGVKPVEPEDVNRTIETVPGRVVEGSGTVVRGDGSVVGEDGTLDEGAVPPEGVEGEASTGELPAEGPSTVPPEDVPGEEVTPPAPEDAAPPTPEEVTPPAPEEAVPPTPEDGTPPAPEEAVPPPGEEQVPQTPVPPTPPDGVQTPPAPPTPPAVPLQIPSEAVQDGSTKFLNGHWRSKTGLQDSETGQPIQLEYDFKDGQGTATLRHGASQQECKAPVRSAMKGGKLVVEGAADFVCPDGTVIKQSNVECSVGSGGRANCKGANADGSSYGVQIVK